jgi:hypothetical protein
VAWWCVTWVCRGTSPATPLTSAWKQLLSSTGVCSACTVLCCGATSTSSQLVQRSMHALSGAVRTDMCVLVRPSIHACGCLYLHGVGCRGTYFGRCVVSRSSPLAAQLQLPHGVPALLVAKHGAVLGKAHIDQFGGADIWEEEVRWQSSVDAALVHGCCMLHVDRHSARDRADQLGPMMRPGSVALCGHTNSVACRAVLSVCLQVLSYLRRFKVLSAGGSAESGTSRAAAAQHGGSSDDDGSEESDGEVGSGWHPAHSMTLQICMQCLCFPPSRLVYVSDRTLHCRRC